MVCPARVGARAEGASGGVHMMWWALTVYAVTVVAVLAGLMYKYGRR